MMLKRHFSDRMGIIDDLLRTIDVMWCSHPYEIGRSPHAVAFLIQRYDHEHLIFPKDIDRSSITQKN